MRNIIAALQGVPGTALSPLSRALARSPEKRSRKTLFCGFLLVLLTLIFSACSKDNSGPQTLPPPAAPPVVDISGVWAGTWSGTDPVAGQVSGNWVAEVAQTKSGITGSGTLSGGDVDCMDGSAEGSLGANNVVSGTLTRTPCQQNEWTMTALNLLTRSTSGVWTQPGSGAYGKFAGIQIAKPGGPRIAFLNPPGGSPGAIVTIVGTGFGATAADNALDFNATPVADFLASGPTPSTTLVARVPYGATTGPAYMTTSAGTAISPRSFDMNVTFPGSVVSNTISVGSSPGGVAIGPDGRKAYVANKGSGTVSMINTATNYVFTPTRVDPSVIVPVQGIVVSPDGRRVYVAGGSYGVKVLDAANLTVLDTLSVNAGGGAQVNPQGLALSPDGRLLYVSENQAGGAVTVLDVATKTPIASLPPDPGATPLGIAPSPDGTLAYIAVSGPNEIKVFNPFTNSVLDAIPVGSRPVGIAVTPNGGKVYVANELGNSVTVYDTATGQTTTKPVDIAPEGIAISPDGLRVFIANKGSNTVSVMSTTGDQVVDTITVGSGPVGLAMSPDGKRAYVTNSGGGTVSELGGPLTLTITKGGTGIGTVTASPEGITCGANCQARYSYGTVVTLSATADGGSYFSGWSGDCSSGTVTMTANKTCTATFTGYPSGGSGGGSGGGGGYYYYGCFIATAAYGSSVDPHVMVLTDFHRKYFTTSRAGRALTEFYQKYAPPMADYISRHEYARLAVRTALTPAVYAIQYPAASLFVIVAILGVSGVARRRWTDRGNRSSLHNT